MSSSKPKHWKSPLHPIISQTSNQCMSTSEDDEEVEDERQRTDIEESIMSSPSSCQNDVSKIIQQSVSDNTCTGMSSQTIIVPYNGLYGLLLGRRRSQSTCNESMRESMYYDDNLHFESRIESRDSQLQEVSTKKKIDKISKVLPLHCGCTFQATFENGIHKPMIGLGQSKSSEECDNRKIKIMLPFTSQIIDPVDCNISKSENLLKVLTNTRVARLLYMKQGTGVTIEYVTVCNNGFCDRAWEWGLALHQYSSRYPSTCISVANSDDNTVKPSGGKNDELDKSPDLKRARINMDQDNHVTHDEHNDEEIVNFFPQEAKKKPLLCTTCYKKFPSANSIYKHAIIAHIETMAQKGSQELNKLIGPSILRKPLNAAFEDKYLVVVVKHQGIIVQGDKWTLAKSDLLMPFRLTKSDNIQDALSKPRPVHRLDSATGGLLVVAKTHSSEVALKNCFAERSCSKRYRAIVFGRLEANDKVYSLPNQKFHIEKSLGTGTIESPISGKESITHYSIVCYTRCEHDKANGWITTVDLYPVTGRQHQLRRHCKLLGHPIWGDKRYGPYEKSDASTCENGCSLDNTNDVVDDDDEKIGIVRDPHSKLCLWALEIIFPHPIHNQDVHVKIEESNWYRELRIFEEKKWVKNHKQE